MDNCGGGQRLPPDGDEFPAAYQEYSQSNGYPYVTTTRDKSDSADPPKVSSAAKAINSFLDMDADKRSTVTNYVLYSSEKTGWSEGPPPLPLTDPPKVPPREKPNDLWRQDNMSEKSVKDKIAMFSSQSNLESPLFPANPVPRRLSKHKSSDDVFADDKRSPPSRTRSTFDLKSPAPSVVVDSPYSPTYVHKTPSYSPPQTKSPTNSLIRATSFSGSCNFNGLQTSSELLQDQQPLTVTRTSSLASTFKRPSDDIRKSSLNQLIEQRRKGISKLRGLVIPEKDAVPVEQPIIDLPEIKSRDSILMNNQVPRSNIQDKWGSQSSLASNASTVSSSVRTNNFKMPAPKILSSYSPAFKRKSLSVLGSNNNSSLQPVNGGTTNNNNNSKTNGGSQLGSPASDAPKSLESICSPTRSDYSFEFVPSSISPDNGKDSLLQVTKPKLNCQRKIGRNEYDDSDNDSAVSSSQSSISRGFSPPASPVPSDRSTMSSERSYLSSETTSHYQRPQLILPKTNFLSERSYSSPPCTKPPASNIPQRQSVKRSVSTESESLSRRVLKPQSVEAINRKNILASARCRSGKELNGSPLIQRKFSDDDEDDEEEEEEEEEDDEEEEEEEEDASKANGGVTSFDKPEIKIAYIEIAESESDKKKKEEAPRLPPKRSVIPQARSVPIPSARPPKPAAESLEASNDMKSWVRAEMRTLTTVNGTTTSVNSCEDRGKKLPTSYRSNDAEVSNGAGPPRNFRSKSSLTLNEPSNKSSRSDDLLTVLTTKSRSRSAIHVEETCYNKLKSPMSLEDILAGKTESKLPRSSDGSKVNGLRQSFGERAMRRSSSTDSWSEEKMFASKIPSPRSVSKQAEEMSDSKIPMSRNLGRRSSSVTDMKKVFEKVDVTTNGNSSFAGHSVSPSATHNRFPSLDSSVEESIRPVVGSSAYTAAAAAEPDQERFGSISSLASSTSLISQQELAQLVEEANLEEPRGGHDVVVVLLHKENPSASVGITLAGGVDCETKEISVHRVLSHSIADKEGNIQRGDRILSINGRSMRGLTHRESLVVLKQPRSEIVLVLSRAKGDDSNVSSKLRSRTESVETIVEGYETNAPADNTAWGPALTVSLYKDGAGLGFSLEGGRDSPLGDRPLLIKKIFTGGAADKTGALRAGDQLLEVNKRDVSRLSRIEAWSLMKKLPDGEVSLLVRHPATKSS